MYAHEQTRRTGTVGCLKCGLKMTLLFALSKLEEEASLARENLCQQRRRKYNTENVIKMNCVCGLVLSP